MSQDEKAARRRTGRRTSQRAASMRQMLPHFWACLCCGRRLTAPASLRRGIGPICWAHLRAPAEAAARAGGLGLLGDLAQRLSDADDPAGAIGAAACSETAYTMGLLP